LWISGLHIPETYLAALVQIACRLNNWPLDRSTLYTNVSEYVDPNDVTLRPPAVKHFFSLIKIVMVTFRETVWFMDCILKEPVGIPKINA
jgi:hypothetical protein